MEDRPPALKHVLRWRRRALLFWADGSRTVITFDAAGRAWADHATAAGRLRGGPFERGALFPRAGGASEAGSSGPALHAPVAGIVARVHARAGQDVAAGETLLVLELMKMEFPLVAPRAARVLAVHAAAGVTVEKGALLVSLAT